MCAHCSRENFAKQTKPSSSVFVQLIGLPQDTMNRGTTNLWIKNPPKAQIQRPPLLAVARASTIQQSGGTDEVSPGDIGEKAAEGDNGREAGEV